MPLEGRVVHGDGLGRKIGFPTANLDWEGDCPESGVYLVRVSGENLSEHQALCSIGNRPTVGGKDLRVEVYIPDFSGDLYGRRLSLDFIRKIRDQKKFSSIDEMTAQIRRDLKELNRAPKGD